MKAPLTQKQKTDRSINFGSQQGVRPHSLDRELNDLRGDVEAAFVSIESNAQSPVIHSYVLDKTRFTAAGNGNKLGVDDLTINGKNFFAGRSRASVTLFSTGSITDSIALTSIVTGTSYNDWSLVIQAAAGNNGALGVAVNNKVITLSLDTDGSGAIENAAANNLTEIRAVLVASSDITDNFVVSAISGDATKIISSAVSSTSFSGGEGLGLTVSGYQPGQDAKDLVIASATDTQIVLKSDQTFAAIGVVGQSVGFQVTSHTSESNTFFETVLT